MKADFARAALLLETEEINAKVAAVDCTVHRKLSEKYEIKGFPTLKYFEKGKIVEEYDGKRTAEDMADFIKSKQQTAKKDEL